jgi:hypothetical protein
VFGELNKALDLKLLNPAEARSLAAQLKKEVGRQSFDEAKRVLFALLGSDAMIESAVRKAGLGKGYLTPGMFREALDNPATWNSLTLPQKSIVLQVFVNQLSRAMMSEMRLRLDDGVIDQINRLTVTVMDEKDLLPSILGRQAGIRLETGEIVIGVNSKQSAESAILAAIGKLGHEVGHVVADHLLPSGDYGTLGAPRVIEEALVYSIVSRTFRRLHLEAVANVVDLATANEVVKMADRKLVAAYYKDIKANLSSWVNDANELWRTSFGVHVSVILVNSREEMIEAQAHAGVLPVVMMSDIARLQGKKGETPLQKYAQLYWAANQAKVVVSDRALVSSIITEYITGVLVEGLWTQPASLSVLFSQKFVNLFGQQA